MRQQGLGRTLGLIRKDFLCCSDCLLVSSFSPNSLLFLSPLHLFLEDILKFGFSEPSETALNCARAMLGALPLLAT